MKRVIKYSSIEQFNQVIRTVKERAAFMYFDEETQKAVFDPAPNYPVVLAKVTEKIHGTNGSICFSNPDGFWVQSRTNIITPESDNASCASYAMKNKDEWLSIVNSLATEYNIDLDNNIIVMYFEWCGDGIQKKTALTGTSDKMAIIFSHFKVEPIDDVDEDDVGSVQSNWFETKVGDKWVSSPEANIFNINDFPTYEFTIDFNKPLMVQNEMISLVKEVIEPASPVGKKFGFDANIGEGIVVTFIFKDRLYKFKVKGEAHTTSKVKTLNRVDDEKLQKIQDIAQKVSPVWRLEQMFDLAIDALNGGKPDMTKMGDFIRLISNDIIKEEIDIIIDAGLEHKTIMPVVSTIARQFFKEKCLESE